MSVRCPVSLLAALLPIVVLPLAGSLQAATSAVINTDQVKVQLLSAMTHYVPGEPVLLALRLQPKPHWHTYWRNPGDSGLETRIEWQLPAGTEVSPIAWPLPSRFDDGGMVSFGYADDTWLLVEVTPPDATEGDFTISARAKWLACREACIPGEGQFTLTLPRAEHAVPSATAADFAAAADRLPVEVNWPARFAIVGRTLQIELAPPAGALPGVPQLFIAQQQLVDYTKPPQLQLLANGVSITQPLSPYFRQPPKHIDLVLSLGDHGYALRAVRSDSVRHKTAWQ